MMVKLFRAAFLGAALLMSATTLVFADEAVVPDSIIAQLNSAAANQSPADYAATVASLVKDNPTLAAAIAGQATAIRPAAAIAITQSVAGVITSTSEAHDVAAAIVANASAGDKSSITPTFITFAPPDIKGPLTIVLADVGGSAPAGGKPGGGDTGGTQDPGFKAPGSPPPPVS